MFKKHPTNPKLFGSESLGFVWFSLHFHLLNRGEQSRQRDLLATHTLLLFVSFRQYIYIYWVYPTCCNNQKKGFPHRDPQKVHKATCYFGELLIGDLSDMACVPTFLLSLQLFIQFTSDNLQLNIFDLVVSNDQWLLLPQLRLAKDKHWCLCSAFYPR